MISPVIVIALSILFFLPIIGYLFYIIIVGVGFNHLLTIHRARKKVRKGYGLVKIWQTTGYPKYYNVIFDGKHLKPFGEGKGAYNFKKNCVYYNEYNIPTIEYNQEDSDPRNPNTGLISVTSPNTLENLIVKAVRADSGLVGFMDWFKKNWWAILIGVAIIIGMFLFTLIHFYDGNMELARQVASSVTIPAPIVG